MAIPTPSESRADQTDDYIFDTPLGRYFKGIFADAEDARRYASVAQRGITLAVHTEHYAEAERVATLMDEAGALNVDEEGRVTEDSLTREERKYNLQAGRAEPNPDAKADFNTRETENPSVESERQVPRDRRAGTPLNIKTRIIEIPLGEKIRYREEQTWTEPQKHKRVDEEGRVEEG